MHSVRTDTAPAGPATSRGVSHVSRLVTPVQLAVALAVMLALIGPAQPPRALATEQPPAASYRLDAAVDVAAGTVDTTEVVRLRNVVGTPLSSIVFRVVPNVVGSFTLRRAAVDGQDVTAQLDGSVLELPLARPLAPAAATELTLTFTIAPPSTPGRLAATRRGMALGNWFPILAVHRGDWDRRQYVDTGDAFFSQVADFDLTLTTSTAAEVVATGQRADADGRKVHYVASNVRDLAVAIAPDYTMRTATAGDTTIIVAASSRDRSAAYLGRATEFIRWLGDKLGPYPYPTLVVADVDLPASYGGMEYPALVMMAGRIPLPSQIEGSFLDELLLHEIAHQWFYALVGNDEIDDPWLDEAFATYAIYAYYRDARPDLAPGAYREWIAGGASGDVAASVTDFPSDGPYINVVYRRGAQFLDGLQNQLGDTAFWALVRDHVATNRDRVATPRAFLDRALDASAGPWSGSAHLAVSADFPVARVQVWLDQRRLADGPANDLTLDLTDVEPGEYVLLVQLSGQDEAIYERSRRIEVIR